MRPRAARLDTLGNRLLLLIFAITAAAVVFVFLYVVPQLKSSLTAEKLRRLEMLGVEHQAELARALEDGDDQAQLRSLVRSISQQTDSRLTILAVDDEGSGPAPDFVVADSEAERTAILPRYGSAETALEEERITSGVETVGDARIGQSALPVPSAENARWIAVLSAPLDEVDANVDLIQRQILIAGVIALIAAALAGLWAARALTRRLHRLRLAAEQVAEGDFSQTIPIESSDELGELARTFNHMQRRLERLDSARKEFIANASHELRTPIFSLGGFVELLEDSDPNPRERREFVREMRAQIERLQKLAADLLDLSRLDAGVMELEARPVDLRALARTIAGDFRPLARRHRSTLELRSDEQHPPIADCDPDRVAQILRILIDNALTHTPTGTKVTISALRSGDHAELIVGDSGRGIDKRLHERVFERFYSGDTAGGSGLGLAIASELAERMDGSLSLVSRRGFTAFTLSLPLARTASGRRASAGATA